MVGGGGWGWLHPQVLLKNGFLTKIFFCLETLKFVVTIN